jgi:hypothetical protein
MGDLHSGRRDSMVHLVFVNETGKSACDDALYDPGEFSPEYSAFKLGSE